MFELTFGHIFIAPAQKQPFPSFWLQFWQRRWIRRPIFPIERGYFVNRNTFSVPFFAFYCQKCAIFLLPVYTTYFRKKWVTYFRKKWVTRAPAEGDNFHKAWSWSDHPLPSYELLPGITANTLRYIVTLMIDLFILNGCHEFFVRCCNPSPNLSVLRWWWSVLELWCSQADQ